MDEFIIVSMSISQFSILALLVPLLCITCLVIITRILRDYFMKKFDGGIGKAIPMAGGSWPILGHLRLLAGPEPNHLVLSKMADKYGPIFAIKLGLRKAVVVNTPELAKDCLRTNDRAFASRPKFVGGELLGYNYAILGLSPYCSYWRQMRKISTHELLASHKIRLFREVREFEVIASLKTIYEEYQQKTDIGDTIDDLSVEPSLPSLLVDLKRWFFDLTLNITLRTIVGKRFTDEADEELRKALRDWIELIGIFMVCDGLPYLRWLDLGGHEKAMKRTAKTLDQVMQRWLEEHKARRNSNEPASNREKKTKIEQEDFMDVLLSTLVEDQSVELGNYDPDTINKATCLTMILAANDTVTIAMTWAISLLLNNKEALKKVQQELDSHIGLDRRVAETDLENLPYLQAVIKETLRLYPPTPLSLPHEAEIDCNVSGYFVPKGTQLVLNLQKIQRDPRVWSEPSEFKPDRFQMTNKDVDFGGQSFELLPFSSGRRMCPGRSMAMQIVGLTLASFLHAFNIRVKGDEAIDMEEGFGLNNLRVTPLEVLVSPRVPGHVYNQ